MTNVEKRVAPIAQQLTDFLKNSRLPVKFFCHDITFPKGRCALLSSNIATTSAPCAENALAIAYPIFPEDLLAM